MIKIGPYYKKIDKMIIGNFQDENLQINYKLFILYV